MFCPALQAALVPKAHVMETHVGWSVLLYMQCLSKLPFEIIGSNQHLLRHIKTEKGLETDL